MRVFQKGGENSVKSELAAIILDYSLGRSFSSLDTCDYHTGRGLSLIWISHGDMRVLPYRL
ncbi:hypothetical protein [Undibacterium sp.]|uniref:hypothetical protein n=1 Tax=Undibacterium sp. TaxID=1914977 RepID=UPI003752389A